MIAADLQEQIERLTLKDRLALLEFLSHSIREELQTDEDGDVNPAELFREAWADAMEGRTHPISTLWDGIEDE